MKNDIEIRECKTLDELGACVDLQREVFALPEIEISPVRHFIVTKNAGGFTLGGEQSGHIADVGFDLYVRLVGEAVEGKGTPGFLKGSGDLDLQQDGAVTKVKYTGDVQVGGTIASVGQRMIQGTAKMMAAQFFTCLGAEAKTEVGEPPPQHGFFRTALRWFSGLLKNLFRKH